MSATKGYRDDGNPSEDQLSTGPMAAIHLKESPNDCTTAETEEVEEEEEEDNRSVHLTACDSSDDETNAPRRSETERLMKTMGLFTEESSRDKELLQGDPAKTCRRSSSNSLAEYIDNQTNPSLTNTPSGNTRQTKEVFVRTEAKQRKQSSQPTFYPSNKKATTTVLGPNPTLSVTSNDPRVVLLGVDLSHLSPVFQFLTCASGVFGFNLTYGYLQEFVTVKICNRELGLFLAMMQFFGYTIWSYLLRNFSNRQQQSKSSNSSSMSKLPQAPTSNGITPAITVPTYLFFVMGMLSAIDMAMANMALHYINYPAKTLMKSCRVIFTMFFGIVLVGKKYRLVDYLVVLGLVAGVAIFMQADADSSAHFQPLGVGMLTISLLCDGATNVMSETTMKSYGIGQDELIFRMFSLALIVVAMLAAFRGDLYLGLQWSLQPGTYDEWMYGTDERTWGVFEKIAMIVLFSSMGFFGSSCSAAITKNFGALAMSMTSTARRATTLFISFFMFDNKCTPAHVAGVAIFIIALTTKSVASRNKGPKPMKLPTSPPPTMNSGDEEMQKALIKAPTTSTALGRRPVAGKL